MIYNLNNCLPKIPSHEQAGFCTAPGRSSSPPPWRCGRSPGDAPGDEGDHGGGDHGDHCQSDPTTENAGGQDAIYVMKMWYSLNSQCSNIHWLRTSHLVLLRMVVVDGCVVVAVARWSLPRHVGRGLVRVFTQRIVASETNIFFPEKF